MCHVNGRLNTVKKFIFPKMIYRFNKILNKTLTGFFFRQQNNDSKIYIERQNAQNSQNNFVQKVGGYILSDFKIFYYTTVIKIVRYQQKIDMQIRETKQRAHADPLKYIQLTFGNDAKAIQQRKNNHIAYAKKKP